MRKWCLSALMLGSALSTPALSRSYVVVMPANLSPSFAEIAEGFVADVVNRLQPGDTLAAFDASHLSLIGMQTAPDDLAADDAYARARVFGELEGRINDIIDEADKTAAENDLDIPVALREVGLNLLPKLPDKEPHILLLGSVIWASRDANWSFRETLPSDGFFLKPIGSFNVLGQETILSGALVSICYTDKIDGFTSEGFRRETLNYWGKSIVGRGGHVGGFQPFAPDCAARLFSSVEDQTPYVIDRHAGVYLMKRHWVYVPVR
jgi:hypothetical protein